MGKVSCELNIKHNDGYSTITENKLESKYEFEFVLQENKKRHVEHFSMLDGRRASVQLTIVPHMELWIAILEPEDNRWNMVASQTWRFFPRDSIRFQKGETMRTDIQFNNYKVQNFIQNNIFSEPSLSIEFIRGMTNRFLREEMPWGEWVNVKLFCSIES